MFSHLLVKAAVLPQECAERIVMTTLNDVPGRMSCRITWMISKTAQSIREFCHLETDERIRVISNSGDGLIFAHDGKRYALSADAASAIRVEM